jgi:SAM-dependent methyltransferase
MSDLPNFTEHKGHKKLQPPESDAELVPPVPFIAAWIADIEINSSRPVSDLRILDLGCGRGDTVFWLLQRGWDAWGIDTDERYLNIGRNYFAKNGRDPDRLCWFDGGAYPFDDGMFDVITSDQVFEHVDELDGLARELSRVSAPGARGLHSYPSRWRPTEPHLRAPLVHWLPKGAPRRVALHLLLRAHLTAPYFSEYNISDRVKIFSDFMDGETFYRSPGAVRRVLRASGISSDAVAPSRAKVNQRLPWTPKPLRPAVAWLVRETATVAMETTQTG